MLKKIRRLGLIIGFCLWINPWLMAENKSGWVDLLDGLTLQGWQARHAAGANEWQAVAGVKLNNQDPHFFELISGKGIIVNGTKGNTTDILTDAKFADLQAHIEFAVSKGSNSGVYFQGLYEVQIFDSFEKHELYFGDCGGIYARWIGEQNVGGTIPRTNASKSPGEWQTFDVWFRAPRFDSSGRKIENARFLKVLHNGVLIHENVEVEGPTRASLENAEAPTGPLLLQGDHGPVAFRNIRIRPLSKIEAGPDRRDSKFAGLAHIAIQTGDLEKTLQFYATHLGFEVVYKQSLGEPGSLTQIALVRQGSCILELVQRPKAEDNKINTVGTIAHFALEVKDIEKVVADLKSQGITFDREIFTRPNLFDGIRGAFLKGPSGESIELFEYMNR